MTFFLIFYLLFHFFDSVHIKLMYINLQNLINDFDLFRIAFRFLSPTQKALRKHIEEDHVV